MLKKEPAESHICIYVRDIEVDVRIGVYAHEDKPQKLIVSVALYVAPAYLKGISQQTILDYEPLYNAVMNWEKRPHVKLIENYVNELLEMSFSYEPVNAARISVTKADIFPAAKSGAGVEVFMKREDYATGTKSNS